MPKKKAARNVPISPWLSANMDCKMGRMIHNLFRHDAVDPDFVQRVQAAFVSAGQALTGAGGMSGADTARLRMLGRMGLLNGGGSADDARRRMIQRRERRE